MAFKANIQYYKLQLLSMYPWLSYLGQHCFITRWATYTDGMDPGQHCFITRWATYTDDMDPGQHCL